MKDKYKLSKSICYIGMINYLTNYIIKDDKDGQKSISFGDGLRIKTSSRVFTKKETISIEDYYEEYTEEEREKLNKFYDGVTIRLEKNGELIASILIGKEQIQSDKVGYERRKDFIDSMLEKPKIKDGEFLCMPKDKDILLSSSDKKAIHLEAIAMIRYLDNRIKEDVHIKQKVQ